jgi:hypothetical protein
VDFNALRPLPCALSPVQVKKMFHDMDTRLAGHLTIHDVWPFTGAAALCLFLFCFCYFYGYYYQF